MMSCNGSPSGCTDGKNCNFHRVVPKHWLKMWNVINSVYAWSKTGEKIDHYYCQCTVPEHLKREILDVRDEIRGEMI